jgi:arylsulfatase A-like enzyme
MNPIRGSGHGSHHDYYTHVPCIFWGGPFRAAEKSGPSTPYDLAPTLADVLGIRLPEATGVSRLPVAPM